MRYDLDKQRKKRLIIKAKSLTTLVKVDEIIYLECDGNLIFIYTTTSPQPYTYTNSLMILEKELSDFGFIRINHDVMVNTNHISSLDSRKKVVRLLNGKQLQVSKRKWIRIKEWLS